MKYQRILLVDDDEDDVARFIEVFERLAPHADCTIASNGQEAIDMLQAEISLPDLVFLDLTMPVINGFDCLRHFYFNPRYKYMTAGVLTGSAVIADMKTAKGLGAKFYLTKPNSMASLSEKLDRILHTDYINTSFHIFADV
jgi:CheY-like chemotaxis protein